jgi:hypothetical protein
MEGRPSGYVTTTKAQGQCLPRCTTNNSWYVQYAHASYHPRRHFHLISEAHLLRRLFLKDRYESSCGGYLERARLDGSKTDDAYFN